MSTRDELFKIIAVVMDNPNEDTLRRVVDKVNDICEREYVKAGEMQRKLLRLRLGLAAEGDN